MRLPNAGAGAAMPPSPNQTQTDEVQIWISLPVAALGVLVALGAAMLLFGPSVAGALLVLGLFGFLPGLAIVRLLSLHDPLFEIVLGIALSFALAGLISVTQAYFGPWSPSLTLAALTVITTAAFALPLVAALVRAARRRLSEEASPGSASPTVATAPAADGPLERPVAAPSRAPRELFPALIFPAGRDTTVVPSDSRSDRVAPTVPATLATEPSGPLAPAPIATTPGAAASTGRASAGLTPGPAAGSGAGQSDPEAEPPPPPPVAVIRKRPKAAAGPAGRLTGPTPRPHRAVRETIENLVDDLADQRDRPPS